MFNPLTRTLKLGLTAITILTAGGFAFAPTAAEALGTEPQIAKCNANPFGTDDSFGSGGCGVTLGTEQFSTAKEQYCDKDINRSKPICKVTAVRWNFENPDAPISPYTATSGDNFRRDQFLQGTPTGVNEGTGLTVIHRGSLNLSTAKFGSGSGEALGGAATDGVNFFIGSTGSGNQRRYYGYAGIFSGTNLGAPITETRGTAKWVGKFRAFAELYPYGGPRVTVRDFILEIDYATRSLDAFIFHVTDHSVTLNGFYQLDGHYDSSGVITGEFELSGYNNGDRTNRRFIGRKGSVTGLIGQEGAVGAFHSGRDDDTSSSRHHTYAGGFVARPAGVVTGAEAYLDQKCEDDPFHELCFTSNQRATRILADCRGERTSTTPAHCSPATVACVNNPFGADCHRTLGGYALGIARLKRAKVCNRNMSDDLCRGIVTTANICSQLPFGSICNTGYDDERLKRAKFCSRNMSDPKCRGIVTTANICSQLPFDSICNTGYDDERLARAKRCNLNMSDDLCIGIVTTAHICSQLPFDSTCDSTRFEYRRTERITFCNDVGTSRNNPRCTPTEVVTAVCDNNLFGTGCLRYSKDNSVYNNKRTVRITTCNEAGGVSNPLCMPADVVAAICQKNLFGTGCLRYSDPDGSYAIARTTSLDVCNIATNSGNSLCIGTKLDNICSYAPFSQLCLDNDDYDRKREDTFETCKSRDSDILSCNGVRQAQAPSGKADATTWADDLITLANPKGISSITSVDLLDVQYTKSQFLEGLEKDFDFPHLQTRRNTPFAFLTLADNLVGSTKTLRGEIEDGVAFVGLKSSYRAFPFYAGILSGTDLGAPITRTAGTVAVWNGVFQAIAGKESRRVKRNFDLTVTFTDSETGTIDAFVNSTGDNYYHLSGNFDSIGVITGTVDYGLFDSSKNPTGDRLPGLLTGLIGQQGAVGAFIADMDEHRGVYAGGFVAHEIVDYVDWAGAATPLGTIPTTTTNTRNHTFVSGERADEVSETEKLNLRTATYNGYQLGGDSADGVAFFKRHSDSFPATHYAGVLSGTDLGSLIVQPNTRAHWSGSIKVVTVSGIDDAVAVDFVLTVDFTDNGGSISAKALNVAYSRNSRHTVHLNGTFGFNGVITGTSRVGSKSAGDGELIGLIGQDGAVGTFISTAGVEYSGGFVARPHSVNIKDLRNYATLETTPSRGLNSGSEFLIAIPPNTELDDNRGHFPSGFSPISGSSTIGRRDGDTEDGYQYFGIEMENDAGDVDTRYYAGILSTTNLGAPLAAPIGNAPTSAVWEGHVSFNTIVKKVSTNFYVNFSDGIIGFANTAGNGTGTAAVEVANSPLGVQLTLNGKFGAGVTDANGTLSLGQLGGDMRVSTINEGNTPLPVTGLIGQDGVVGVFVNPSNTSGAGGGFVASAQ